MTVKRGDDLGMSRQALLWRSVGYLKYSIVMSGKCDASCCTVIRDEKEKMSESLVVFSHTLVDDLTHLLYDESR